MTNIFATPEKGERRDRLKEIGLLTLENLGWKIERVPGAGKSSMRRITKDGQSKLISIRTTQDTAIAFPRTKDDAGWLTLDEVDLVMAVSVDNKENPKFAQVHLFEQRDIKDRYDRAYDARIKAGRSIPIGRGVWVPLYEKEAVSAVNLVGAGAGLESPPIARVPLMTDELAGASIDLPEGEESNELVREAPLTIAEAKRRLALAFGVDPSAIKITVEG